MVCVDCGVALVSATSAPPVDEARLGRFDAPVAHAIADLLADRGIRVRVHPHDPWEAGERILEVLVPSEQRDELRAELVVGWPSILRRLDPDTQLAVRASRSHLPGWDDAPDGAWIDRDGRLQVSRAPDEEAAEDAQRTVGPALVGIAALLLLFAWYADHSGLRLMAAIAGIGLLVIGAFLPR